MALLNKTTVRDFTKERYLAVVRSHPYLKEERNQLYLMLILTFLSLSFLGVIAINPTLTTITELNKKLEDSIFVNQSLKTKIAHLSSLNTQYNSMPETWPIIDNAVPNEPRVVSVLGQIQTIARESGIKLQSMQSFEVALPNTSSNSQKYREKSFTFTVTATGSQSNLLQFVKTLSNFNRLAVVESIHYSQEDEQTVIVRLRSYFLP